MSLLGKGISYCLILFRDIEETENLEKRSAESLSSVRRRLWSRLPLWSYENQFQRSNATDSWHHGRCQHLRHNRIGILEHESALHRHPHDPKWFILASSETEQAAAGNKSSDSAWRWNSSQVRRRVQTEHGFCDERLRPKLLLAQSIYWASHAPS